MNTTFIYFLRDPETPHKGYVGKSNNPARRFYEHLKDTGTSRRPNWVKALAAQGKQPVLEILDEVATEYWQQWEVAYIEYFREQGFDLVNGTAGGDGVHNPTAETRVKIREAKLGKKNPNFGKPLSDEAKANLKVLWTGEKNPQFGKTGARSCAFGRERTAAECEKMSVAKSGKKHKDNTSGFVGIYKHKLSGKWQAEFTLNRTPVYVGLFSTLEDAVFARALAISLY